MSSAVNSWWQLIKVDENENEPRELKFGTDINFSMYIKIPVKFLSYQLSSAVNSWLQVVTADENENQPRQLKLGTHVNFSVHMKIPVIFFQSSCHQLWIAVNSWVLLMKIKINLESQTFPQILTLVCKWKLCFNFYHIHWGKN